MPLLVLILVTEVLCFQILVHFREHEDHLFKLFTTNLANHCVTFWSDTSTSWLFGDQRELSKELGVPHAPNVDVLLLNGVFDENLALSTLNNEHMVSFFTLVDQWEFRVKKSQFKRSDKEVNDSNLLFKYLTLMCLHLENYIDNLTFQSWTDRIEEELELLLSVLRLLSVL